MKTCRIAILGATGAVGRTMLQVLEEQTDWEIGEVRLLASPRSAGQTLLFKGQPLTLEAVTETSFEGMDVVLGAVENDLAKRWAPWIVKAGAVFVDNSSAFRLDPEVPLVIPQINPQDIQRHQGIIANPNCATILALMAVAPIYRRSRITRMMVSTYQAVSGAGAAGLAELKRQITELEAGKAATIETFPAQIAYNLIPQIGGFNEAGYSSEEMKLNDEGQKILHDPELRVSCTCVRVPVLRCHSESIYLETEAFLSFDEVRQALEKAEGVVLNEQPYPTPLRCTDQDLVEVGRLRRDLTCEKGIALWCCGDQLRKGAATNAVEIVREWWKSVQSSN